MWDEYGKGGVSIGFSKEGLKNWAGRFSPKFGGVSLSDDLEQNELVQFKEVNYYSKEDIKREVDKICADDIFDDDSFDKVFLALPFKKTSYWAQENEYRIAINYISTNTLKLDESNFAEVIANSNDSGTKHICDIPFDPSLIKSITLAPDCNLCLKYMGNLLENNGFDTSKITIKRSIATKT